LWQEQDAGAFLNKKTKRKEGGKRRTNKMRAGGEVKVNETVKRNWSVKKMVYLVEID
jgi:hypothetical protein